MRILLVHNYYQWWGGEDNYFNSLVRLLRRKGHTVVVYTKDSKKIQTIFDKIKVALAMFWNWDTEKELAKIIKNYKPDIAQVQNIFPLINPTVYHLLNKYHIPIIQRVSNYRFMCPKGTLFRNGNKCESCVKKSFYYPAILFACYQDSRISSFIFSFSFYFHKIIGSFNNISLYLFPTEFIRRYYINTLKISRKKTEVIPTFSAQPISSDRQKKKNYFIYAGRLSEEKGIRLLVDTFKKLPRLKLIIIGDGPLGNELKKTRKYKNIIYKGFLEKEKTLGYIRRASFTIIPSLSYDVMPNVLIESYSVGTPVIVSKIDSFLSLVDDKKTGLFFDQNKRNGLKEILVKTSDKNLDIENMGVNAKNKFEKEYSENTYLKRLIKVYASLKK